MGVCDLPQWTLRYTFVYLYVYIYIYVLADVPDIAQVHNP